ncbi:MAG TPA: hypothetical protein VMY35_09865 [Phycisphaerae bacterium]|nr:hypothetical protein [Phycisphaerae bacterium]
MCFQKTILLFMWKAFAEWKPALEEMFGDILTPEFEAKARQNATDIESDYIGYKELVDRPIEAIITDNKIAEFRRRYSHIRVYHGCRPEDIKNYYRKGLLCRDKAALIERFRSIFLTRDFPELTEEMLQQSLTIRSDDDGELCLAIDDRHIITQCGHYLIYGSEYLAALVIQLPIKNSEQYLAVLRKIGKPTFYEINLPNTQECFVSDNNIFELLHDMLTEWTHKTCHPEAESRSLDFTVSFLGPLPPEYICSHYHPKKIPDPNMGWKIYDAETGQYAP